MQVLHLVKTMHGAAWAWRQISVLRECGLDVTIACPEDGPMRARYEAAGASVVQAEVALPHRAPWRIPSALRQVRELVGDLKPDLIHSHFVTTTLALRLALGRSHPTPRIFQVPGPLHLGNAFFRRADRLTMGPQDYVIGSCQWTCRKYRELGVSADRVFLSYYGTDVDAYSGQQPGALRAELAVGSGPLVGMIAWMYPPKLLLGQRRGLKGHEDFLYALRQVFSAHPSARAVIVGQQWGPGRRYQRQLQALATRLHGDKVLFLGPRDDVPSIYADLDLALHPSLSENVGGAVESLLAACPTVASNVGGLPDLVQDGVTGWLVPPRRPDLLAEAMLDALAHPEEAHRRAHRGRELARVMFDVNRTGREIVAIYGKLMGSPQGVALGDTIA